MKMWHLNCFPHRISWDDFCRHVLPLTRGLPSAFAVLPIEYEIVSVSLSCPPGISSRCRRTICCGRPRCRPTTSISPPFWPRGKSDSEGSSVSARSRLYQRWNAPWARAWPHGVSVGPCRRRIWCPTASVVAEIARLIAGPCRMAIPWHSP